MGFLHALLIEPLIFAFSLIYGSFLSIAYSQGAAIVGLSIVVNLICLPLYRMADKRQAEERAKQQQMEHWVKHIRKHFAGDERQMMLSAYYRIEDYHPTGFVFGSLPLLLQIPFFMAAYQFLSNLDSLNGVSFMFLHDLGLPDGLVSIAGVSVNVLPLVMTGLNCISTFVYTKESRLLDKVQAYGLAAVFLVLLYDSPSGLVFYWCCNQLFSLVKNLVIKSKMQISVGLIMSQLCALFYLVTLFASGAIFYANVYFGTLLATFEVIWVLAYALGNRELAALRRWKSFITTGTNGLPSYLLVAGCMACMLGLLVPSATIADSPAEFVSMLDKNNPCAFVLYTASVFCGLFLVWGTLLYVLSPKSNRNAMVLVVWCLLGVCMLDYFCFDGDLGVITDTLSFQTPPVFPLVTSVVNVAAALCLCAALAAVWHLGKKKLVPVLAALLTSIVAMSLYNINTINDGYEAVMAGFETYSNGLLGDDGSLAKCLSLSREGRNVVVLFMDRAVSGYVPYVLEERPELRAKMDGFTYYPNTISYGISTIYGSPSIYGGYEYTPAMMDARPDEWLADKHDEALKVMPAVFGGNQMQTYVVNPPYTRYKWTMDSTVFEGLRNVRALNFNGVYSEYVAKGLIDDHGQERLTRSFAVYSIFRVAPTVAKTFLYDNGKYLGPHDETSVGSAFFDSYSVLEVLDEITGLDDSKGDAILIGNCTTHEPTELQLPNYTPALRVDNTDVWTDSHRSIDGSQISIDTEFQQYTYCVNMASYIKLCEWFDWMRANGVYDNTKIVIVSDHGSGGRQWPELIKDGNLDVEQVNPVLMVKDYGAHGFSVSHEFMATADVPTIAMEGIVEDPVNPYTGLGIDSSEKGSHDQYVTTSRNAYPSTNHGKVYDTSDSPWYSVHDNIFDLNNWTRLDGHPGDAK